MKKTFDWKWLIPITVSLMMLVACNNETPVAEQPLPEQPEATATPTEVIATAEPESPTEISPETDTVVETPEISQPVARWNAVSEQGNWVLVEYGDTLNPTVVEPDTYVTINFSVTDGQASGSGGCNNYSTNYTSDDEGNLTINSPVDATTTACETGMEQETLFLGALETVSSYTLNEKGYLLLNYDSGTVYAEQLIFLPESSLFDAVWFLTAYGNPDNLIRSVPSMLTTLTFSIDGTLNGSTGCNNYIANYTLQENQITVNLPAINLAVCAIGAEQEQAFLAVLGAAQSYRLSTNTLEITAADGSVLRFSAQHLPLENVRWLLASMDGQPVPEGVSVSALFTPADSPAAQGQGNMINGKAGCNTFFGSYSFVGDTLTTGPFGSTQMMCEETIMQMEQSFLTGLESAQSYQITGNQLFINTASGSLLFYADRLPLKGPKWILTGTGAVDNPQPPTEGAIFTAIFSRQFGMPSGVKFGETGCNNYTVTYSATSDEIKVNLPQTSRNICSDAQAEIEQGYFLGLNAAREYRILGNELSIYYDDSVLIFVGSYSDSGEGVSQEPPGPLTPLNGTQWWLTSIDNTNVIPESEVTIFFEINSNGRRGSISGSGGCNNYSTDIVDVFTLWPINVSSATCDTPEGVMDQEDAYLAALQYANGIQILGNTLKITTDQETLYFTNSSPEPVVEPESTPEALVAIINAPRDAHVGQVIKFNASMSTSSAEIISYQWWFSDGTTGEGITIERTYDSIGVNDVILTIKDANGQTAEASMKLSVHSFLIGPTWVLDGTHITLKFSDGTFSGNAGCNDYSGSYAGTLDPGGPNDLTVSSLAVTDQTCDEKIMEKEQAYLTSLETVSSYTIDVDLLILTTTDGTLYFDLAETVP